MEMFKFKKTDDEGKPYVIRLLPPLKGGSPFHAHASLANVACPICDLMKEQNAMPKRVLEPVLIPQSAWGQSLAGLHRKDRCKYWPTIREEASIRHGHECAFCTNQPNHGHEVWKYDDQNHVLTLIDVVPVCEECHNVIHLGRSELLAAKGELDYRAVLAHFVKVRGIKKFEMESIVREAFDTWEVRSRHQWTVNFGEFAIYIHEPGKLPSVKSLSTLPVTSDKDRVPSETRHVKWLSVRCDTQPLKDDQKKGHIILAGTMDVIDQMWPTAARMTLEGVLGTEAFCSTIAQKEIGTALLRDMGVVGLVLGPDDDKEAVEMTAHAVFGKTAKSIKYKKPA